MREVRYRQLVRGCAVYDVLATAAFATPWTFRWLHQALGGVSPLPAFDPLHALFVNLLGSLVLVWAALRIWRPAPLLGLLDAIARGLFLAWQLYYLLVFGVTPIVWGFAVMELALGLAQGWGYARLVAPSAVSRS